MELEPGPFHARTPLPLGRRIVTPGDFLSLASDLVRDLRGITAGLDVVHGELAADGGAAFRVDDGGAIGDATNGADAIVPGSANDDLAGAIGSGGAIEGDASGQAGQLPGPDDVEPDIGLDGPIEPEPAAPPEPPPGKGGPGEGGPGPEPTPPTEDERYQAQVREAIRRMYRELLFREADPGGLQNWMDWVIIHGQTLEWVREQILNSEEYRQKHGG